MIKPVTKSVRLAVKGSSNLAVRAVGESLVDPQ